ncbi:MAG: DUF177 domain-containing protein [Acidocella sp.]|nr:DUF177 domain-containing protein [Acidocella sp.]
MSEIFSRRMKLGGVATAPVKRVITATAAECAALAALFGLPGIAALEGEFVVSHERGGVLLADLKLSASVTQICVVTLEPFDTKITEATKLRFVPAAKLRDAEPLVLDAETLDGPDEIPYGGDTIDLGAVLAEQLALALDPYPRKPGATLPEGFGEEEASGPMAALLAFKKPGI